MLPEKMADICLILAIGAQHCGSRHHSAELLCLTAALAGLKCNTTVLDYNRLGTLALICLYTIKDRPQDGYLSLCTLNYPISRITF